MMSVQPKAILTATQPAFGRSNGDGRVSEHWNPAAPFSHTFFISSISHRKYRAAAAPYDCGGSSFKASQLWNDSESSSYRRLHSSNKTAARSSITLTFLPSGYYLSSGWRP